MPVIKKKRIERGDSTSLLYTDASSPSSNSFSVSVVGTTTSNTSTSNTYSEIPRSIEEVSDIIAQEAIYNHLRFLRAAGRNKVNVEEVARALSLSVRQVKRIAVKLGVLQE